MNDKVEELLTLYDFDEVLEMSDLTEYEVLQVLFRHGYLVLPPFLEEEENDQN